MIELVVFAVALTVSVLLGLVVVTLLDDVAENHEGLVPYDRPADNDTRGPT